MSIRIADIKRETALFYGISRQDIEGQSRKAKHCTPRHVAMVLSRELTTQSTPAIGRQFGPRDHSTVIRSTIVLKERLAIDKQLASEIDIIRNALRQQELVAA